MSGQVMMDIHSLVSLLNSHPVYLLSTAECATLSAVLTAFEVAVTSVITQSNRDLAAQVLFQSLRAYVIFQIPLIFLPAWLLAQILILSRCDSKPTSSSLCSRLLGAVLRNSLYQSLCFFSFKFRTWLITWLIVVNSSLKLELTSIFGRALFCQIVFSLARCALLARWWHRRSYLWFWSSWLRDWTATPSMGCGFNHNVTESLLFDFLHACVLSQPPEGPTLATPMPIASCPSLAKMKGGLPPFSGIFLPTRQPHFVL